MALNLHGTITKENYKEALDDTAVYGPKRVGLSLIVKDIMDKLGWIWTLDGGTLLGAWRDGKMLLHDDDFDFLVYNDEIMSEDKECDKLLTHLLEEFQFLLPKPYQVRKVTSYAKKLEVYDPTWGSYPFKNTDYYNVTCDITLLTQSKEIGFLDFQHSDMKHVKIQKKPFFPISSIQYEGFTYNAPGDPETYLKDSYGYIGRNAIFNRETGFYEKDT